MVDPQSRGAMIAYYELGSGGRNAEAYKQRGEFIRAAGDAALFSDVILDESGVMPNKSDVPVAAHYVIRPDAIDNHTIFTAEGYNVYNDDAKGLDILVQNAVLDTHAAHAAHQAYGLFTDIRLVLSELLDLANENKVPLPPFLAGIELRQTITAAHGRTLYTALLVPAFARNISPDLAEFIDFLQESDDTDDSDDTMPDPTSPLKAMTDQEKLAANAQAIAASLVHEAAITLRQHTASPAFQISINN